MTRSETGVQFAPFVAGVSPDLLAYFVRRLTNHEDAADCVAETFVVLWRRRASIPVNEDAARAWVFGIARNVLQTARRSQLRRSNLADRLRRELREETVPPVDRELDDALSRLRAHDAELVRLVAWEGFGVEQAGSVLGLSPTAARKRYSRARAALRELLT